MENENIPPEAPKKEGSWLTGCLVILAFLALIGPIGYFVITGIVDAVGGDDEDYYEYDSDDKDSDGDVDYDDAEKYLKDSLEEDKNDGDDW